MCETIGKLSDKMMPIRDNNKNIYSIFCGKLLSGKILLNIVAYSIYLANECGHTIVYLHPYYHLYNL